METKVYAGVIREGLHGENDCALFVGQHEDPLAKRIAEDAKIHGQYLSCRYAITTAEFENIEEGILRHLYGSAGDTRPVSARPAIEYVHRYSETTGYLWTAQWVIIGGHDLLDELYDSLGKYLWMEMKYSEVPFA